MSLNVVILAAGQGTRMHSAKPKVLHLLAGRPLVAHVVATARVLNPTRISVVYGHGGEQVPQALRSSDLVFVRQEPQLGTGHAVMQALPELEPGADVLVLYGDVPLISAATLQPLIEGDGERLRILTAKLEQPFGYGRIVRRANGAITGIVEEKEASPEQKRIDEVNTGIMLLPGARLAAWLSKLSNRNQQNEYYLTDIVALALKDRVTVEACAAPDVAEILGVNSKQQLAQLERLFQVRRANALLAAGVTLADPARIDVRGDLRCGRDVRIDVSCIFEGDVDIGDDAQIGAHCVLKDSTIGAGARIEPFSLIDGATVGASSRIGPYARIRPGTELAQEVHIGNFVEVKATTFGARSKANHLAYVGDSSVGANVNIGAGTITCNYDGANKHRTVIEDDVHIGSDVQLVAPVTVAKGVTVGAGTTVWQETPPGGLIINPKNQQHRPGWKRPVKQEAGGGRREEEKTGNSGGGRQEVGGGKTEKA